MAKLTFVGHATFKVETDDGTDLVVDPFLTDNPSTELTPREVPADFGDQELIWTLTTNGRTERAYASLRTDYLLDAQTIATEMGANFGRIRDEWRDNRPPELALGVDQPRTVRVGQPLTLVAFTTDDGIPSGQYIFDDDYAPLLPKGAIVATIAPDQLSDQAIVDEYLGI